MNKIKEKKLNSIKSQIVEITNFVETTIEDKTKKIISNNKNDIQNKEKDTFTLTKIVNPGPKSVNSSEDISFIKHELKTIKLILSKQEKILETILLNIK